MSQRPPQRPQNMGQVLQSLASAIEDERKRGLPRFNREQVARIQAVVQHLSPEPVSRASRPSDPVRPQRTRNTDAAPAATMRAPASAEPSNIPVERPSPEPAKSVQTQAPAPASAPTERLPWMVDETRHAAPSAPAQNSSRPSASEPTPRPHITPAEPQRGVHALESVQKDLIDCQRCGLCATRTHIIVGEGNPNARLMLIGEAPSSKDDQTGRIFDDAAGDLLTNMLQAMTLSRQDVYCTNVLKCHPPNHRAAQREELAACAPFLRRQIEAIKPEVILTLGSQASRLLLGARFAFAQHRGEWNTWENIDVMPTWHPSYLLQHPREKASAWQDLQKVMQKLGLS